MRFSVSRGWGLVLGSLAVLFIAVNKREPNDCEVVGDPSTIISACSHIIDGNGETMHKRAIAFANRASAYVKKGDSDRAIADANEAIRLDSKVTGAYVNRAGAYLQKGDNDRAIADASEAVRLDPKMSQSYFNRGLLNLYVGSVDKALADLKQAGALVPNDAYTALWLDIVGQRNNLPSRLSQSSAQLELTAWPAPVVKLFMGQLTPGDLLAAADDPNAPTKKGHVC
jgi:lipoprotein NlpI